MKRITTLTMLFAVLFAALTASPALANEDDKIWDAINSQFGVQLKGKYKESPENGLIDQTLEVEVEDAPPGVTLSISINGMVIGTMTTNAFGRAEFRMDKLGVLPGPGGRPRGPRIETGDVLRVFKGNAGISARFVPRP